MSELHIFAILFIAYGIATLIWPRLLKIGAYIIGNSLSPKRYAIYKRIVGVLYIGIGIYLLTQ